MLELADTGGFTTQHGIDAEITARPRIGLHRQHDRTIAAERDQGARQRDDEGRPGPDHQHTDGNERREDQTLHRADRFRRRAREGQRQHDDQRHDERRRQHDDPPLLRRAAPQRGNPVEHRVLRHQRAGGDDQDRVFIGPVEHQRRDQRSENTTEHTTERHGEIEAGQPVGRRAQFVHRGVQRDRNHEQQDQREPGIKIGHALIAHDQNTTEQQDDDRGDSGQQVSRAAPRGEGNREAQQIQAERQHPQQRHRNDVGGDVGRGGEHQARRHQRQHDPVRDAPRAGRGAGRGGFGDHRGGRAAQRQRTGCDQQRNENITTTPQPALAPKCKAGFDDQRIGDQAGKAAEIRRRVERIGVLPLARDAEPALQQRRLRRNGEEQRPDRQAEQPRHPDRRLGVGRQLHRHQPDRQPQSRHHQHREMDHSLPARRDPAKPVRIGITAEQQRLINQHRRVPHRRRTAEPRQRHPRDHRLDEEQQERSGKDRHDEQRPGKARGHEGGGHQAGRPIR